MTEKEKRDLGMIYNPNYDKELGEEILACKEECFAYNQLPPSSFAERTARMRRILGSAGKNFTIVSPFWCDYGYNIQVGENFYANHSLVILDGAKVTFGDNVFIAPDCGFYTAGHPTNIAARNQGLEYARPIRVGDNVWIGGGVRVLPGVTIGNNVIIGAGSVVTKDIPDGVIAFGNPCRVHRKLTEEELGQAEENAFPVDRESGGCSI